VRSDGVTGLRNTRERRRAGGYVCDKARVPRANAAAAFRASLDNMRRNAECQHGRGKPFNMYAPAGCSCARIPKASATKQQIRRSQSHSRSTSAMTVPGHVPLAPKSTPSHLGDDFPRSCRATAYFWGRDCGEEI